MFVLSKNESLDGLSDASTINGSSTSVSHLRTAVVHDWLPVYAGAERVLEQMLDVVPRTDIFTLLDFLNENDRAFIENRKVTTSFVQRLPFARRWYRHYLPIVPVAVEQFDLSGYDLVISSSYVVAKGVLTTADQLHISYVHTPIRYAWDLQFQYLKDGNMNRGIRSAVARLILHYMRLYDAVCANRVDVFVANSHHVARRIWKTYRRRATVIHPPVDTDAFTLRTKKDDYYLTASRLVPYKKIQLIVEAFNQMPDKELVVVGDGPEFKRIKAVAGPNIRLLGYQPFEALHHYMQGARAFVFAAEEDFGIVPVEAQACGTPVIAYGRGGVTESVIPGETGLFFEEQTTESIQNAVWLFESNMYDFDPILIRKNAERFSSERFRNQFSELIQDEWRQFRADYHSNAG